MKWILLGAALALLVLYPAIWSAVVAAVAWLAAKPVVMAFVIGLVVRPHLPGMRRWAR
jgi:hypothetical protein